MARRGRPQLKTKLIDSYEGSEQAKKRMRAILATLSGEWTTAQAAKYLECNEAMFYAYRSRTLKEALQGLEPRQSGRQPKPHDPKDDEIARLKAELERARHVTQALNTRLELAVTGVVPLRSKKRRTT